MTTAPPPPHPNEGAPRKNDYSPYLQRAIESLEKDEFLQQDLDYPLVQEALRHWLGIKRLPSDEAERKFNEDSRVLRTFSIIKNLQETCAKEGAQFPLDLVLKNIPASTQPQTQAAGNGTRNGKSEQPASGHHAEDSSRSPSVSPRNSEPKLEGVLKKKKSEPRIVSKETTVKFADPAENVEMTIPAERRKLGIIEWILRHPLLSMEPVNVARWWSLQFFAVAVYFAYLAS